jgi:ATP phosphoribosyltransferase
MLRKNELVSVVKVILEEKSHLIGKSHSTEDLAREIVNTVLRIIQDGNKLGGSRDFYADNKEEKSKSVNWKDFY